MRFISKISYCSGGVTFSMYRGTSGAPIRLSVRSSTRKEKVTGGLRTSITSPTRMVRDGFTLLPPIETRSFLQASAASERVLKSRTAHIHLSILTSFISVVIRCS